jgi:hypothetical protein
MFEDPFSSRGMVIMFIVVVCRFFSGRRAIIRSFCLSSLLLFYSWYFLSRFITRSLYGFFASVYSRRCIFVRLEVFEGFFGFLRFSIGEGTTVGLRLCSKRV